jgi:hypothetical protein
MMFSAFNCMSVDSEERLITDITQVCFNGSHTIFSFSVALPGIFLWALGIPLYALIMLLKHKKIIILLES